MRTRRRPPGWPLPLLLPLLLLALPPAHGGSGLNFTLNICVIGDPAGWDYCDPSRPSSSFTGFDIELWRDAAARAGWAEENVENSTADSGGTVLYRFVCADQARGWSTVAGQLAAPGTMQQRCAAGAGDFTLTRARMDAGLQFSLAYYTTGLAVLVKTNKHDVDIWAFWTPFNPTLWVAFFLTITCTPPLTWLVEQIASRGVVHLTWDSARRAHAATFAAFMAMFNASFYRTNTLPAQLPNFCLVFLIVIVMATYTASLASVLSVPTANSDFTSITDLRARNVAAHSTYVDQLGRFYGLQAADMPWNGTGTFENVKGMLMRGELDAYVMDYPELGHYVSTSNPDCAVMLLPHTYTSISYGFLFHHDFPAPLLDAFNAGLFAALETDLTERLGAQFLTFLDSMEKCAATTEAASMQVQFMQLAGLWIMLAGSLALTLSWSLVTYLAHRAHESTAEAEGQAPGPRVLSRSASSLVMRAFSFMKKDSTYEDSADPYARN